MRLQCSCSAFFSTSDALRAHLDEYRTLEGFLCSQLEIYRSHSKVDNNDSDSDDHDPDEDAARPGTTHCCPFKDCNRSKPFKRRQSLRRHFEQHVKCDEVCVVCKYVSKRVRDFVRHAERHQDVGTIKTTYINQMCEDLRKRAADELDLAERPSHVERANKRAREDEGEKSSTSGVQKAKLHMGDVTNVLEFPPANDAHTAIPFPYSETALMVPANVAEHVAPETALIVPSNVAEHGARAGFPNISTEAFPPGSIEGPVSALDDFDFDFDAPIFGIINWPGPWTG